jgi:hypothetical protein
VSSLLDGVRALVLDARAAYRGTPGDERVAEIEARLDEPLRVAIAGKVKAGKSTLLNALVGDELAPTDASECTRVVTWYRDGTTYRATVYPRAGTPRDVPFGRAGGAIIVDLEGCKVEDVERLEIEWPSASLRSTTLIDTPGLASLSTDLSALTVSFLTAPSSAAPPADAVLYLLRHVHANDVSFLESFRDEQLALPSPVNAIGVLARADEVAPGRLDAMEAAATIAARYRADPRLRRLCQTVVPVAGLLAQAGATLREDEYRSVREIAGLGAPERSALLRSTDRFANAEVATVPALQRARLLDRLGWFGAKLAVELVVTGAAPDSAALAAALVEHSGVGQLRDVLAAQFGSRRDVLKCRSALRALDQLVREVPCDASRALAHEIERVSASAHEFAELWVLDAIASGTLALRDGEAADITRLLGAQGAALTARVGLEADAPDADVRTELLAQLGRWRRRAESPVTDRTVADAARVAVRTCEGLLASIS